MKIDRFWVLYQQNGEAHAFVDYNEAIKEAKRIASTLGKNEYVAVCPAVKVFYPEIKVAVKETSTNMRF